MAHRLESYDRDRKNAGRSLTINLSLGKEAKN